MQRTRVLGRLALKSLWYRRTTVTLLLVSIALSSSLLLGVERIRSEMRESFSSTVSGTDLLVGARSSPMQLLLYAIFHKGQATKNVSWETFRDVSNNPKVAWTIPVSLGDSHKGFRVIGTTPDFFAHYQYGNKFSIGFRAGGALVNDADTVIGAKVADQLHYQVGDPVVIAHGLADVAFSQHKHHPFRIAGIMAPTGTPIDEAVIVSLDALEAVHSGWRPPKDGDVQAHATPASITAFLVGLKSRASIFQVQRYLNDYEQEALQAVIPGVTLMELWNTVSVVETTLLAISLMVTLISLIGLMALMLATLNERRREMALLRALGARRGDIFLLVVGEAFVTCLLAVMLSFALLTLLAATAGHWLESWYSLRISLRMPSPNEWFIMAGTLLAGVITSLVPAWQAYRHSLQDGMTPR